MSGKITKSKLLLDIIVNDINENKVWFGTHDEDYPGHYAHQTAMRIRDWEELGSPEHITVTIEPGDLLNSEVNDDEELVISEENWVDLPDIPDGWRILWCNVCLYSVTFDDETASSYGQAWEAVLQRAIVHDAEGTDHEH